MFKTKIKGLGKERRFPPSMGYVMLTLSLLFLVSAMYYEIRFVVFGQTTIGVINRFERIGKSSYVYIDYQTPSGENAWCRQTVLMRERFHVGQQVSIRYLADNPQLGRITSYLQLWQPLIVKLVMGLAALWASVAILRPKN